MSNITTTVTNGPYIMSYKTDGTVFSTQQPSVHPLLVTPMVVGTMESRTITPVVLMPGKENTKQYRRDMDLAVRAANAFNEVLANNGVEGFTAAN